MAASIRTRPLLLKSLYLSRSGCVLCRQCQTTADVGSEDLQGALAGVSPKIPRGQIEIPKRKKRDSCSILRALSATVGRDPTGPKYVFIDDPKFIPTNRFYEKVALLSKASGKRTARYIVNEYKSAFDHNTADPHVPAFMPDVTDYKYTDVSVEALKERISRREVNNAIEVYKKMEEEGIDVSPDVKLSFLELLCVLGVEAAEEKLLPEERAFWTGQVQVQDFKKILILACNVFESLPEKTEEAYNWIVRAMANNSESLMYYKEMKKSNIQVYKGTYDTLLTSTESKKDRSKKWDDIKSYLREMKASGIVPDLETFHSVLKGMKCSQGRNLKEHVPSVLAEMNTLEIEPTMKTWFLVLSALDLSGEEVPFREKGGILADILDIIKYISSNIDKIEPSEYAAKFQALAMRKCSVFRDTQIALRLLEFREELGHRFIISSLDSESRFFDSLMFLVCKTETSDVVMNTYNRICPSLYVLSTEGLKAILSNLAFHNCYHLIRQIWQDAANTLMMWELHKSGALIQVLDLFQRSQVSEEIENEFVIITKEIFNGTKFMIDPESLFSPLVKTFLHLGSLDNAWKVAQDVTEDFFEFDSEVLNSLLKASIESEDAEKVMWFCQLPASVRIQLIDTSLIAENYEALQQFLDKSQLDELMTVYEL